MCSSNRDMLWWVQKNVSQQVMPHGGLVATIRRDHVFEDSLQLMCDLPSMDLKNRLRISFIDALGQPEPGIDGGGLFKDFIENLLKVCTATLTKILPRLNAVPACIC